MAERSNQTNHRNKAMHTRMLATFAAEHAATSAEARDYASRYLLENGFVGEGRWSHGMSDWFVIGGRWSGHLTRALLDQKTLEKVDAEFERRHGWWIGGKDGATEAERLEQYAKIFRKAFPDFTGTIPAWRDQYRSEGYEDDAMLVTQALYDSCLTAYAGQYDTEDFCDFEFAAASPAFVGKKWVVVVDYHA